MKTNWFWAFTLIVLLVLPGLVQAAEEYIPGVKIALEVRTADGDLRSFQRPGSPPTYWAQNMPVVQGDQVTVTPLVATGPDELKELKIRLDHEEIAVRSEEPWRVKVDTKDMVEGYHLVEVWAVTESAHPRDNSGTATFLVVPQEDPLLKALRVGSSQVGPPLTDEERLSSEISSRDESVNQSLRGESLATVDEPTLFYVSAGPAAKEFFYTLTRDGLVTYTSPRLPILTHVLLEPVGAEGRGEAPGEVILTVRAGDGEGRFGPPAWVTLKIEAAETAEVQNEAN